MDAEIFLSACPEIPGENWQNSDYLKPKKYEHVCEIVINFYPLSVSAKACEAWQKDAKEAKEQAKVAEAERQLAEQKRKDSELKLKELQGDFDTLCRSPSTPLLRSYGDLDQLPLPKLHSIQSQLRSDLDLIDGVRWSLSQHSSCHVYARDVRE